MNEWAGKGMKERESDEATDVVWLLLAILLNIRPVGHEVGMRHGCVFRHPAGAGSLVQQSCSRRGLLFGEWSPVMITMLKESSPGWKITESSCFEWIIKKIDVRSRDPASCRSPRYYTKKRRFRDNVLHRAFHEMIMVLALGVPRVSSNDNAASADDGKNKYRIDSLQTSDGNRSKPPASLLVPELSLLYRLFLHPAIQLLSGPQSVVEPGCEPGTRKWYLDSRHQ